MNRIVVSVKDLAAQVFGTPFFVTAVGAATRSFSDEVNRVAADNQLNQHPADFELYEIASFDDANGFMVPLDTPRLVARAVDLKNPPNNAV